MQKISSDGTRCSTTWGRLRWSTAILHIKTTRRKGLCSVICLQSYKGIYLDLLLVWKRKNAFRVSLKKFIGRPARPERIYSDNGRTFIGATKWVKAVMKDERLHNYLSVNRIKWQFNLSRAPWCGSQFERIIGIMKSALHKSIGNRMLSWKVLQEVLLDADVTLNN